MQSHSQTIQHLITHTHTKKKRKKERKKKKRKKKEEGIFGLTQICSSLVDARYLLANTLMPKH